MSKDRKANIIIVLLFLGVIVAFAYSYNVSITTSVSNSAKDARNSLQKYNDEIIAKLVLCENTSDWEYAISQYHDIVIVIENDRGQVVARSKNMEWTALDIKVRTPFDYKKRAYMITTSMYLLRDSNESDLKLAKFIFVEFLIGLAALALLSFVVYSLTLRPYRKFYQLIEEYERGKTLSTHSFRGYIGQVYARFVSLTKNLEHQQENQRRIIASISHDIKTPLTSILGYAERIKSGNIPRERELQYLETVYAKANEIQQLVDEFDEYLSYNTISNITTERYTTADLEKLFIDEYANDLEINNIRFSVKNNAEKAVVMLDVQKMRRVFGNIISNSVKHIKHENGEITVTFFNDKEKLYICISDNGEGVAAEKLDIIFEPLYTSDEGRKVAGLGLAICREIVERHSGSIYAKQVQSGGLQICIELNKVK